MPHQALRKVTCLANVTFGNSNCGQALYIFKITNFVATCEISYTLNGARDKRFFTGNQLETFASLDSNPGFPTHRLLPGLLVIIKK